MGIRLLNQPHPSQTARCQAPGPSGHVPTPPCTLLCISQLNIPPLTGQHPPSGQLPHPLLLQAAHTAFCIWSPWAPSSIPHEVLGICNASHLPTTVRQPALLFISPCWTARVSALGDTSPVDKSSSSRTATCQTLLCSVPVHLCFHLFVCV